MRAKGARRLRKRGERERVSLGEGGWERQDECLPPMRGCARFPRAAAGAQWAIEGAGPETAPRLRRGPRLRAANAAAPGIPALVSRCAQCAGSRSCLGTASVQPFECGAPGGLLGASHALACALLLPA
jgi:hypothetical protein